MHHTEDSECLKVEWKNRTRANRSVYSMVVSLPMPVHLSFWGFSKCLPFHMCLAFHAFFSVKKNANLHSHRTSSTLLGLLLSLQAFESSLGSSRLGNTETPTQSHKLAQATHDQRALVFAIDRPFNRTRGEQRNACWNAMERWYVLKQIFTSTSVNNC